MAIQQRCERAKERALAIFQGESGAEFFLGNEVHLVVKKLLL